jgi:hypothetical protein
MTRKRPRLQEWQERIRAEYAESPGLKLTLEDAKRFWALERTECQAVLDALVAARFLKRTRDGSYIRDRSN